jgi:hypothetical protein
LGLPLPAPVPVRRSQVPWNVIKNKKSTCNSAGSSVWSLAPPPGHPAAGRCAAVPCQYLTPLPLLHLGEGIADEAWGLGSFGEDQVAHG